MGKIRVKTIGEESEPSKKKTYEEKKAIRQAAQDETEHAAPLESDILDSGAATVKEAAETELHEHKKEEKKAVKSEKTKTAKRTISKRYSANIQSYDKTKSYALGEAIDLLKKFKASQFDETVELHINVKEEGISGTVSLPHGTGKEVRIKIADDTVIGEIEKGNIDFDVLIASPSMMPQLAKVAKVLGPRGLMPNPKNGTVTDDPKPIMEKLSKGQIRFRTEPKAPVIHMSIGKVSFDASKLSDNIKTVLNSVGSNKISKITLKSSMSPGIKVIV